MAKDGKAHDCETCGFRRRYDEKPGSLLGRLWRWHIGWCPGWRSYLGSRSDEERATLQARYGMRPKGNAESS